MNGAKLREFPFHAGASTSAFVAELAHHAVGFGYGFHAFSCGTGFRDWQALYLRAFAIRPETYPLRDTGESVLRCTAAKDALKYARHSNSSHTPSRGYVMTSVLPRSFEAAQLKIKRTNKILLYAILGALPIVALLLPPDLPPFASVLILLILVGVSVAGGLAYLNYLCRKLGYVCPYCHKPLYDQKGRIRETGICPRCKRSVL